MMPMTSSPRFSPTRSTARMWAFMPGASPPLVNNAIRFMACEDTGHTETPAYEGHYVHYANVTEW